MKKKKVAKNAKFSRNDFAGNPTLGTFKRILTAVFHAVYNFETHWELKSQIIKTATINIIQFQNNIWTVLIKFLVKGMNF